MGREKDENREDIRDFFKSEEVAAKFVEESVRYFERGFDFFIASETNLVTLFKGDFIQPHEGFLFEYEEYETEFLAGEENSVAVRDNILRLKFLEIIEDYIEGNPTVSTDSVIPNPITDGLKKFIGRNPWRQTRVTALCFEFLDTDGDKEQIVVNRFLIR